MNQPAPIIAVDLDGTLLKSDTLHESVFALLRESPLKIFALPFWLIQGKALLKAKIAANVALDVAMLPYNKPLIEWLTHERAQGRKIVLCTASDQHIAQAIANHLGIFDGVLASDGLQNNAGTQKRTLLEAAYGVGAYDYAGNAAVDLKVWAGARQAIVVNASNALIKEAAQVASVSKVFPPKPIRMTDWYRVFRVHQWLKNLLLFVPLLAAHQIGEIHELLTVTLAFIAFSLCASAVYMVNDLLDLESDRMHPNKRQRPFASGLVPIQYGAMLAPLCIVIGFGLGLMISHAFAAWLFLYLVLTLAYTLYLKRMILLDCLLLATLYTIRIIAGAAAVLVPLSFWLLAFSIFIFLSLAFVKRYAELQMQALAGNDHAPGRGYAVSDAPLVQTLGVAAGYAAVLVLALYLHSETVMQLYTRPEFIWFAVPLMLFWVSWVWLKAHRGQMHDDPIVFAIKDRASLVVGVLITISFLLATLGFGG